MSTATVDQAQNIQVGGKAGHFSTEVNPKAYGFKLYDADVTDENGSHKRGDRKEAVVMDPDKANELDQKGLFEGSVVPVKVVYPSTPQGLMELWNSPQKDDEGNIRDQKEVQAEILRNFIAGSKIKVNNDLNARLTAVKDDGNIAFDEASDLDEDGNLDMTGSILRGSKRVFLTEEQKTWKNLSNLPHNTRVTVFHAYLSSTGKPLYTPEE